MSELRVNKVTPRSGTTVTLGDSGDTFTLGSGANIAGLTLSDNILFDTASKGIYLGVTTATASNLLDDYEEGTFTPTVGSGVTSPTYTVQDGSYIKIGSFVYFSIDIDLATGTAAAAPLEFHGLPFAASNTPEKAFGSASWSYGNMVDQTALTSTLGMHISYNQTKLQFFSGTSAINGNSVAIAILNRAIIVGSYRTNA